ncbi:MAG: hypothetical protein JSS20_07785 [Proteobacteria bacterium]|nr:hypothetical protein [Pseudomonadota bacterium]
MDFIKEPAGAVAAGIAVLALILVLWSAATGGDKIGFVSFLARLIHIAAAMLWIGMIWFVNFVQLDALAKTDDAGRAALMGHVVPQVALIFRMASHLVVLSGAVLLGATGYVLDSWVFASTVYIPPLRGALMIAGAAAGLAMWWLVHFVIRPNLRIIVESTGRVPVDVRVRQRVRSAARLNFGLGVLATTTMVAAAHLY